MRNALSMAFCCAVVILSITPIHAQDIRVNGQFVSDSLRVGDEIFYALTARYPQDQQILFPDSSFYYGPFEFRKKRFFVTETKNGISFDSAVFHLSTFEVDSLHRLRLPVYRVNALDCTRYFTTWDTVRMQLLVKVMPEKMGADLPVRATIGYQQVPRMFNFPLVLVISGMTLVLAGVVWVAFGKRFKKYYAEKRLRKAHLYFVNRYSQEIDQIKEKFSPEKTEAALSIWKKYMEDLNKKPYTKLTTKETMYLEKDQQLVKNLRTIDAAIYGSNTRVVDSLLDLRGYADLKFDQKLKEVKHEQ